MNTKINTKNYTREDFNGRKFTDLQVELQANLDEFEAEVATLSTEDLEALEQEIIKTQDEFGAKLQETEYDLPKSATYDGKEYKAGDVQKMIVYFINKIEVDWQNTLGIYETIRFWKSTPEKVPYAAYDTTIRLLGTIKFKGEKECLDILVVNNYMAGLHDEYMQDTAYIHYNAAKHNLIIKQLQPEPEPGSVQINEDLPQSVTEQ